jgi:hypothetical protein
MLIRPRQAPTRTASRRTRIIRGRPCPWKPPASLGFLRRPGKIVDVAHAIAIFLPRAKRDNPACSRLRPIAHQQPDSNLPLFRCANQISDAIRADDRGCLPCAFGWKTGLQLREKGHKGEKGDVEKQGRERRRVTRRWSLF